MGLEDATQSLSHLRDNPDAEEEVQVIDFDNLSVVSAVIANVSMWGCRLTSNDVSQLYKNIGIQPKNSGKMIKALVTSVKANDAAVIFQKSETQIAEKRREKRNNVEIPVSITDADGATEISGKIVDAGNNGCRIAAKGLSALSEEVLLTMKNFDRPVVAEFAWRTEGGGGLRLLWDRVPAEGGEAVIGGANAGEGAASPEETGADVEA